MDSSTAQVRVSVIHLVREYVEKHDVEFMPLLEEVGLSEDTLEDYIANVPLIRACQLFENAGLALKDPCFGLHLSKNVPPGRLGPLSKLALSAPTVRDAIHVLVRFVDVFITKMDSGFREKDGLAYFHWSLPREITESRMQFSSFISALLLLRFEMAIGHGWRPIKCKFDHRRFDCEKTMVEFFGDRLEFDQPYNQFIMDSGSLDSTMPYADPAAFAEFEDLAKRWENDLAAQKSPDFIVTVREHILQGLGSQQVNLENVARSIGIKSRVLQNRLGRAGTSFEEVLKETRSGLAQQLLKDTDKPLTDIAFDLGYSDPSVFTRAAYRWFQMSPRKFRQLHRSGK